MECPFLIVNCDQQDYAELFLLSYNSIPREKHLRSTLDLFDRLGEHLDVVGKGGRTDELGPELDFEIALWRQFPLTSDAAEGLHRAAKVSTKRAAYTRFPWVLSTNRLSQNMAWCDHWIDSCYPQFEYNWDHWSRLLQTHPHTLFRAKRQPTKTNLQEVYRTSLFARQTYSSHLLPLDPSEDPPKTGLTKIKE